MKTCTKCGEAKPLEAFHKHKQSPDGRSWTCKVCACARARKARAANVDVVRKKDQIRQKLKDKEKLRQVKSAHYQRNRGRYQAWVAERRARKANATPPWADRDKINAIYAEAAALRAIGVDVDVDHIVPLKGRDVSGLHVHFNLQLMLSTENKSKGNRFSVSV